MSGVTCLGFVGVSGLCFSLSRIVSEFGCRGVHDQTERLNRVMFLYPCRNMIKMCRKDGTKNPDLWVQVLTHLVNKASPSKSGDGLSSSPGGDEEGVSGRRGGMGKGRRREEDDEGETGSSGDEADDEGDEVWDDLRELLAMISRDGVLPTLQVRRCLRLIELASP